MSAALKEFARTSTSFSYVPRTRAMRREFQERAAFLERAAVEASRHYTPEGRVTARRFRAEARRLRITANPQLRARVFEIRVSTFQKYAKLVPEGHRDYDEVQTLYRESGLAMLRIALTGGQADSSMESKIIMLSRRLERQLVNGLI